MLPVLALVGRPNVGKSTLFNRLTRSRDALVADFAGLTRDRQYGKGEVNGRAFIAVDTGGISGDEAGLDELMAGQSLLAMEEATAILFIVDCRDGLTAADQFIADKLRALNKPVFLVANKIDGLNPDLATAAFYELALGPVYATTATHGRGVKSLMSEVVSVFPAQTETPADEPPIEAERGIKIAVVGRPNVGKSTLVNRLLGEERVVVFDLPGTTRDSVYIDYERHGNRYTLIDTAGIRRRKNIRQAVEKFSIVKTLQAIDDANVVILLVNAREGLVDQDLHLMGNVVEAGRALVVAINKWDGLDDDQKQNVKRELDRRLRFVDFADVHFISALHGTGVGHLYESVEKAYASATHPLSTNRLTQILIVIHGNQTGEVPAHYVRYLEKTYRRVLNLHGTPVKIQFKTGDNPYAGKRNKLTPRQQQRKRRLMKHVKRKRET